MSETLRKLRTHVPPRLRGITMDHPGIQSLDIRPRRALDDWTDALKGGRIIRAEGMLHSCGVGLWVVGPRGSDLLATVMMDAVETMGVRGLYLPVTDYLDSLRGLDSDGRFNDRVETDELLVLANVGTEAATEWTKATVRALVIKRYEEGLPTLVSAADRPEAALPDSFAHDAFVPLAIMGREEEK